MALAETTFSAAVGLTDKSVQVTSATGISAGMLIQAGAEWMQVTQDYVASNTVVGVLRGRNGSLQQAHPVTERLTFGVASDFSNVAPGAIVNNPPAGRARPTVTYSASGAITLPVAGEDLMVIINGTSVCAMTIANPSKDLDGCIVYIVANGAAAHTLTVGGSSGIGGAGSNYDVLTANGTGTSAVTLIACNELWVASAMTGTLTNIAWALA